MKPIIGRACSKTDMTIIVLKNTFHPWKLGGVSNRDRELSIGNIARTLSLCYISNTQDRALGVANPEEFYAIQKDSQKSL
jgi:hypothetical protein